LNDLVNRIAIGQAELLGIEDICKRLGISRATFDRWVKNGSQPKMPSALFDQTGLGATGIGAGRQMRAFFGQNDGSDSSMSFPPPDFRLGNSPKWEMATFKRWLQANVRPGA
jgi:hypothetical protein